MTVASSTSKSGPYTGNGATTVFAFAFKVQAATDVKVLRTVTTDGNPVDTELTVAVDYTVAINADQNTSPGGNVTMLSAPTASQKITILRNMTATQGASIPNQGGFYPKVVENALDKLTMLYQQLAEEVGRALKLSVTDTVTNLQELLDRINTSVTDAETAAGAAGGSETAAGLSQSAAAASAQLAADWAAKPAGTVDGVSKSAKQYAADAAASAASIAGGPVTSVNGQTGIVTLSTVGSTLYTANNLGGF
jgi:hypothetical protein